MITGLDTTVWQIAKIFTVFGLVLYLVFALVVVRQIQLMTKTLEIGYEGFIKFLGFIHLLFAIATLLFAIIVL